MESPNSNPYAAPQAAIGAVTPQQLNVTDEIEITPEFITAIEGGKDLAQAIYMQLMCSVIAFAFSYIFVIVSVLATVIGYLVLIFLTVRGLYKLKQLPVSRVNKWFRCSLLFLYSFIPVYVITWFCFMEIGGVEGNIFIRYATELGEILHTLIGNLILAGAVYSALMGIICVGQHLNDQSTSNYSKIALILFSILFLGKVTLMFLPAIQLKVDQASGMRFDTKQILTEFVYIGLVIAFALFTAAAFRRPPRLIDELIRYEQAVAQLPVAEEAKAEQP